MDDTRPTADTITPAQAEVDETIDTQTVEWMDITITLPASVQDWDLDALIAFERGQATLAVVGMFGPDAYAEMQAAFRAKHGRAVKVRDLESLMDVVAKIYGFETAGE